MRSNIPLWFCGVFVGVFLFIAITVIQNKNEQRWEEERKAEMKSLGITEATVGGVRIICQKGQNCICLNSWNNKQLTCNFKPE